MGSRKAFPLCAEAYRQFIETLHTDADLRERMPTGARVAIYAMYLSGLRVGEATSMRSGWLSPAENGLSIAVPDSERSGGAFIPKTESGARSVPVPSNFTDHVTGDRFELECERVIKAYFVNNSEVDVHRSTVRRWVHETAIVADLGEFRDVVERVYGQTVLQTPDVITHDGRASWCAQCLRSDVNRYTVRDWGGWSDMSMINRYAKHVGDPSGEQIKRF